MQVASDTLLFQSELVALLSSCLQTNVIDWDWNLTQSDWVETDEEKKLSENDF